MIYDVEFTFLSVKETYGWQHPYKDLDLWPWRHMRLNLEVSLAEVTPESINSLALRFLQDDTLLKNYLIRKAGYNETDPDERKRAFEIYKDWELVTEEEETYPYMCQMSRSLLMEEYKQCLQERKPKSPVVAFL